MVAGESCCERRALSSIVGNVSVLDCPYFVDVNVVDRQFSFFSLISGASLVRTNMLTRAVGAGGRGGSWLCATG